MTTLALARLPVARLVRTRRAALAFLWWIVFAVGATLLARNAHVSSADGTLLNVYLPFVLPLVTLAVVSATLGGHGLVAAVRPLVRFGASPRLSALVCGAVASLACAVVGSLAAALLVVLAHNAVDPPLGHDVTLSAYAGALGGAAHGAFFVLGSAVGARGGGRGAMLVVNWLFGVSPAWISVLVPYAHTRSLLGGLPAVTLSEPSSAWALVAIIVISLGASSLRVRR